MDLLHNLNIDPVAIAVDLVGFGLLLWVCNGLVFKPIGKLLADRQGEIDAKYDKVDSAQREMETARADYQRRLNAIEEERRDTVQKAINEAQTTRDQIVHEAQVRAQEMVSRAEQDVNHEREQALITLRGQVVDLAMGAVTKVIGESLDETRQRRLIDDFIGGKTAPAGTQLAPATPTTSTPMAA